MNQIDENRLMNDLGVPKKRIAQARKRLQEGAHYTTDGRGMVVYTKDGINRLLDELGLGGVLTLAREISEEDTCEALVLPPTTLADETIDKKTAPDCLGALATERHDKGGDAETQVHEAPGRPSPPLLEAILTVDRKYRNPKILVALHDGNPVRVRVTDSKNYAPGMQIPCRQVDGDLWEITRRAPRWYGRW